MVVVVYEVLGRIIKRDLRQALEAESVRIDETLIERCVDVAVGAVGTSSPVNLMSVAYYVYKKQFTVRLTLLSFFLLSFFFFF
ncbi:hypothetical protein Tcan_03057 [Toxocara canis]|uniref:Uncharacterized protein n=1 Tax=Toxocara canis TaxID=6265 RepID=A0A0B2VJ12_TOXCA|nr:hypothetical protein Tcan_03057 [Toxocara canis]